MGQKYSHLPNDFYLSKYHIGYLNDVLRTYKTVRRTEVRTENETVLYVSIVDLFNVAGYSFANQNWRNILKCYLKPEEIAALGITNYATVVQDAKARYLEPSVSVKLHGKTSLVPVNSAVQILCCLPVTRDSARADVQAVISSTRDILHATGMDAV